MASSRAVSHDHSYVMVSKYASPEEGRGFQAPTLEPDMLRRDADSLGCFISNECLSFPVPWRLWVGVGAVVAFSISLCFPPLWLPSGPNSMGSRGKDRCKHACWVSFQLCLGAIYSRGPTSGKRAPVLSTCLFDNGHYQGGFSRTRLLNLPYQSLEAETCCPLVAIL